MTLSQNEKDTVQAQETLRLMVVAHAALTLDEFQEQVAFWGTRSAVIERALSDARMRLSERNKLQFDCKNNRLGWKAA